ncbi:uncharacterized protein PHACADRAFT_262862 [Phanerochaete carnosa HHB-10118-sp]|uniref:DUF6534 domain-containing protein n=1 Tax=Phanerochaete carnosa (strain HHB-10118-sp) TaxID=650164 RepID=K5UMN4_PHACS|nr:uncharacterized protein PHACADRAFT_262862 [Phanerochaete carnosa HHB-10118-sp]EKM50956.1 hypothetical protein PHACADRAFT_262862 [Phanerochaete carnosa HHB-10118-sp]
MQATPSISPDPYLGPYLIGTVVTAIFFGILCLQCYLFFRQSGELQEGCMKRALIASIWLLNAFNLFSLIWLCYSSMVTNFGDLQQFLYGAINWFVSHEPYPLRILAQHGALYHRSIAAALLCTAWSKVIAQGWLSWHIWMCSGRNRSVCAVLGFGVVTTCCLSTALAGKSATIKHFSQLSSYNWLIYLNIACDACTNLGITAMLSIYLSRARRSPLYSWDYVITAPVVFMSNTGILCLIEILLTLVVRICRPNDFIFWGILIPYSTVYANALLGFLNTGVGSNTEVKPRFTLSNSDSPEDTSTRHVTHADMRRAMNLGVNSQVATELPLAVHVERIVEKELKHMETL